MVYIISSCSYVKAASVTATDGETTYMILSNVGYSSHGNGWYETEYSSVTATTEWFDIEQFESFTFTARIGHSAKTGSDSFNNTAPTYTIVEAKLYSKDNPSTPVRTLNVSAADISMDVSDVPSGKYVLKLTSKVHTSYDTGTVAAFTNYMRVLPKYKTYGWQNHPFKTYNGAEVHETSTGQNLRYTSIEGDSAVYSELIDFSYIKSLLFYGFEYMNAGSYTYKVELVDKSGKTLKTVDLGGELKSYQQKVTYDIPEIDMSNILGEGYIKLSQTDAGTSWWNMTEILPSFCELKVPQTPCFSGFEAHSDLTVVNLCRIRSTKEQGQCPALRYYLPLNRSATLNHPRIQHLHLRYAFYLLR